MVTKEQLVAVIQITKTVAESIRELKRVPSGHLYAQVMGHMDLSTYNSIIDTLKRIGVVREENHELIWQEPPQKEGFTQV